MSRAWVLLTAMPPTKGHIKLVEYAQMVARDGQVEVIVVTQPEEPMPLERLEAVRDTFEGDSQVNVHSYHKTMPQDPETPGFQEMWNNILRGFGAGRGDYVVASESYGQWLADGIGGIFIPYDPGRELTWTKAESIRVNPLLNFDQIAEEFQFYFSTPITIFGAESCGKTTLAKALAHGHRGFPGGHFFMEWARPYLEMVGGEQVTRDEMLAIWQGQMALQDHSFSFVDKPFHFYDTDLFSTVGYWALPHWAEKFGPVPFGLVADAIARKSDLYIICPSNIPFEEDPLRYGGNVRESGDKYWVDLCKQHDLNYVVLKENDRDRRYDEALGYAMEAFNARTADFNYDRKGF
jgi:HTH-type transcriptional repressor of NAD biosynthesis genes